MDKDRVIGLVEQDFQYLTDNVVWRLDCRILVGFDKDTDVRGPHFLEEAHVLWRIRLVYQSAEGW